MVKIEKSLSVIIWFYFFLCSATLQSLMSIIIIYIIIYAFTTASFEVEHHHKWDELDNWQRIGENTILVRDLLPEIIWQYVITI